MSNELLDQISEKYQEWFEMEQNPDKLMITILANKLKEANNMNDYLKMRLNYVSKTIT